MVTLALDRDALGCATVPLTQLARRFADAAAEAEAEDAGAGAGRRRLGGSGPPRTSPRRS